MLKKPASGPRQPRIQAGSNRAPTFSYRANRLTPEELPGRRNKPQRVKLQFRWHHIPAYIVGVTLLVSIIYSLTLSSSPRLVIKNLQSEALLHSQADYYRAASQALADNLTSRTKITFDSRDFDQRIRKQFPEVEATAVTLPLMGRRPVVELVLAQPALLLKTSRGQYVIDTSGRVIAKVSMKQLDTISVPFVDDQSNQHYELGKGALPSQSVDFITTFITQLENKSVRVSTVTLPPKASEAQFKLEDQSYFIKTSLLTDARLAAGSYLALKQKLDRDNARPAEYIDVRVEEKVYFK